MVFCASGAAYQPASSDLTHIKGFPVIGKWMIAPSGRPADWIGIKYKGKEMREPINIVIIDVKSKTAEDSIARISGYCEKAGYKDRKGHSSGYSGYIGGSVCSQLPRENDHAFSNGPYELSNNHGRMFGPYKSGGKFYFIGAFSREVVGRVGMGLTHKYGSFMKAQKDFVKQAARKTELKVVTEIFLDNAFSGGMLTTGDHDGYAVVLGN